jgi:hypothetical protein
MKSIITAAPRQSAKAFTRPSEDAGHNGATQGNRTLPPDPENMNGDRAKWARAALRTFRKATGADVEEALGDLLADLMHWSDRNSFDFDAALERARTHYEAETAGEETP